MGLYDDQIKQRIQNDEDGFLGSFVKLSGVVMGSIPALDLAESEKTRSAIEEILKYYKVKVKELPDGITELNDQLDYLLRPSGIMRRQVKLSENWHQNAIGALLGTLKDSGDIIALIPRKLFGYDYYDFRSGKRVRVTKKEAENIAADVYCFYRPFPQKAMTVKDFLLYLVHTLSVGDFILMGAVMLAVTLIGMITPYITKQLFSGAIYGGNAGILVPAAVILVGAAISAMLFSAANALITARINTRSSVIAQASMMMRMLSLPASFYKDYSAGDIASRASCVEGLCAMLVQTVMTTSFTSVFSLIYIGQIFAFAPALAIPALSVIAMTLLVSVITAFAQLKLSKKMMEANAKENGLVFSLISGIQKIKLAGAEHRAFAKWTDAYAARSRLKYAPPALVKFSGAITTLVSLAGVILIYYCAAASGVGIPNYMAMSSAYGMTSGAFMALTGTAIAIAGAAQTMNFMKPIFDAQPEVSEGRQIVTRLSGGIEINNVSFRYSESMPVVLDDISLKIRPGQYVAIVGQTGCGKSTLMRPLHGFEQPAKGAVYYDGKDLAALDLKSVRKHIGVVTQDGKLFQGDVFSNIIISAPWLTMDEAWEAAETAGIADDIHAMPMGMYTMISEGGGGISGGQKQRLMIARAVAPKPKVLFFDEATSALDNITQKIVSDNLEKLKCTRIVIAHRLSTIKNCDRIIVLQNGKIAEDGNYDGLIEKDGIFADLVRRQMIVDTGKLL